MSDLQFWQLYGWTMCGLLWLFVALHAWRQRRRRNRLIDGGPHHSARRNGTEAVPR